MQTLRPPQSKCSSRISQWRPRSTWATDLCPQSSTAIATFLRQATTILEFPVLVQHHCILPCSSYHSFNSAMYTASYTQLWAGSYWLHWHPAQQAQVCHLGQHQWSYQAWQDDSAVGSSWSGQEYPAQDTGRQDEARGLPGMNRNSLIQPHTVLTRSLILINTPG